MSGSSCCVVSILWMLLWCATGCCCVILKCIYILFPKFLVYVSFFLFFQCCFTIHIPLSRAAEHIWKWFDLHYRCDLWIDVSWQKVRTFLFNFFVLEILCICCCYTLYLCVLLDICVCFLPSFCYYIAVTKKKKWWQ